MCPFVEKQLRVPAEKPNYTFLQIRLLPGILRILQGKILFKGTSEKENLTVLQHQKKPGSILWHNNLSLCLQRINQLFAFVSWRWIGMRRFLVQNRASLSGGRFFSGVCREAQSDFDPMLSEALSSFSPTLGCFSAVLVGACWLTESSRCAKAIGRQAVHLTCETDWSDEGFFYCQTASTWMSGFRCLPAKHQPRGGAGSLRFQVYNLVRLSCQAPI